jgi:hypothetical protein
MRLKDKPSSISVDVNASADGLFYGRILGLLTLLFFLRVLGQILVVFLPVIWLPAAQHWESGLIPYPILLAIQIVMLIAMLKICSDILRGQGLFAELRPSSSRFLIGFSALYAAAMILRYVLTMAFQPDMRWWGDTIPIFFHFVLAAFIFVFGSYNSPQRRTRFPGNGPQIESAKMP